MDVYGKVKAVMIPTAHSVYKTTAETSTKLGKGGITDRCMGISFTLKSVPENPSWEPEFLFELHKFSPVT